MRDVIIEIYRGMVKMKKISRSERIDYIKYKRPSNPNTPKEELGFMIWKAELNKELMSFWKSMILGEEDQ